MKVWLAQIFSNPCNGRYAAVEDCGELVASDPLHTKTVTGYHTPDAPSNIHASGNRTSRSDSHPRCTQRAREIQQ